MPGRKRVGKVSISLNPTSALSRPQRRDEILGAELPPTLPVMALRSTIVYPLGTIAVQMGAPENLALLRDNEDSGLVVGLVTLMTGG